MTYSNKDLQTSHAVKGNSRIGVGHDGVPKHFAKAGEPSLLAHPSAIGATKIESGMQDQTNTHGTTSGKIKHAFQTAPPLHSGTSSRFDADPPSATGGPPAGKITRRAEINPGCRSRNADSLSSETSGVAHARAKAIGHEALHALGAAVMAQARLGAGNEHPSGLRMSALPGAVDEET
jgi:hypothetical protein